jgi:hypothetical protein
MYVDSDTTITNGLFPDQQVTYINNADGVAPGYFQAPDNYADNVVYALDTDGVNTYVGGAFTITTTTTENYIMGIDSNNSDCYVINYMR